MHLSSCAIHNAPALEAGACDCGDSDLANDLYHCGVVAFVSLTGRFGFFVNNRSGECFVEAESAPRDWIAAIAAASDLPDASNLISILCDADRVDFYDAMEAIICELKALTISKGIAGCSGKQLSLPNFRDICEQLPALRAERPGNECR